MAPLTDSLRETVSAARPAQGQDAQMQGAARLRAVARANARQPPQRCGSPVSQVLDSCAYARKRAISPPFFNTAPPPDPLLLVGGENARLHALPLVFHGRK